ncbi:MAG TPA: class I SAM-dependent methyltransferase, partial [Casimicrobiaceae bacterium]|nr:class I SAM-dependent methyltransferase [Casimicrobiaceae bacterium]
RCTRMNLPQAADRDLREAMQACIRSLRAGETPGAKAAFVHLVKSGAPENDSVVRRYLTRALAEPWCRPGQLVPATFALIRSQGAVGQCIERALGAWPGSLSKQELFGADGLAAMAADDLLVAVLENTPAIGLEFEHFLTLARRAILIHVASPSVEPGDASLLRVACALARQCYINEYVYNRTAEEDEAVAWLREKMSNRSETNAESGAAIAAFASYAPLHSIADCERLASAMMQPPLAGLFAQQVKEPLRENEYRATLRKLTPIDDVTSKAVGHQYEANPYPRWVRSPSVESISFRAFVENELGLDAGALARRNDRIDVLIAGCGTGQQSIQTAQRFSGARILAVDLSAASLAYARRKTRELRLSNVEYAQADILQLDRLGKTFDYIECVGVLHHLDDPLRGWRVLRSLLRPGGIMRIGLYSALARRDIAAAARQAAELGYTPTAEHIRRFRLDLQLQDRWRPFRALVKLEDFYDTSGCRDLLFHVKEHRFTMEEIKRALAELELQFVRFNVDADVQHRYSQRFPGELARTDLTSWNQFELEHPDTFVGMYNFYVRHHA